MATALLIGTNAWADNVIGNDRAALQKAIDDAASGTTLTLQNDFTLDGPVWLGTEDLNGAYKSIELDLNGHKISMTSGGVNSYMFVLSHGELLVRNSSATQALIELTGSTGDNNNTQIFTVFGSYKSSRWNETGSALQTDSSKIINTRVQGWFSHLEIGQNVKIVAGSGVLGSGIAVDGVFATEGAFAKITGIGHKINYKTDIFTGNYSLAQGVRVDVYGEIEMAGAGVAEAKKAYGIKVNGNVWLPSTAKDLNSSFADATYKSNFNTATRQLDTIDVPFVYVHSSAKLVVDNKSTRATAVYSSGYSKMLIEGHCEGAVGVYANSGKVEINDAEIVSTSQTYAVPTSGGGVQGSGSAVIVNSRDNYTGSVSVTISGDSKVTASSGYAIEEIVNTTSTTTKVDNVAIEGGTIEGGSKGAIIVSDETASDKNAHVTFYGGTVAGNTQVGTAGDINDILPTDNNNQPTAHVTIVTDPDTGKQTIVVSEGANAPSAQTEWGDIMKLGDGTDVNWTGTDAGVLGDGTTATVKKLGEVHMTAGTSATPQQLTVRSKATLEVKHLIMNKYAQITVEPGAKLIVTGEQGIVAPVAENIVLEISEENPSIFLFNPAVSSNRHPHATVKIQAKQIGYMNVDGTNYWFWHRFALPIEEATAWTKIPNVPSYVYGWNYENDNWEQYTALTQMKPFCGTILTADQGTLTDVEYTFTGVLAGGNENNSLKFVRDGYHYFGNSYTGHISIDKLVEQLMGDSKIDGTVWVWGKDQNYHAVPLMALRNNPSAFLDYQKEIAPMQTFVLKQKVADANNSAELNYGNAVWGNPRYDAAVGRSSAPRRHVADETTRMRIVVTAENGKSDDVMFFVNGMCSDELDNGYDASKYMNENALNMYAAVNGQNYSVVATDNIEGKALTINTVKDVNYTMSFANVNGEEYAIRDNVTGAVVAIEEGATYDFSAQPDAIIEGRFEIVGRQNMPTAIENTEAAKNAKGIFTIMGQYVGEDFDVLPAGIYVVNGVKIVK